MDYTVKIQELEQKVATLEAQVQELPGKIKSEIVNGIEKAITVQLME